MMPQRRLHQGIMLMGLLMVLALGSIALLGASELWSAHRQHEREVQLLFVGDQYRRAIRSYYYAAPSGTPRVLPANIDVLLQDDRYALPLRHLRRPYPDPITGQADWGELRVNGRLSGLYSSSDQQPLKQAGFAPAYEHFALQSHYRDWVFGFSAPGTASPTGSSSTSSTTARTSASGTSAFTLSPKKSREFSP